MANQSLEIYKSLVAEMLPKGMLDYYDLTEFTIDDEPSDKYLCNQSFHLYLYEKDNRSVDQKACSESLGYNEGSKVLDYPIMGKRAVLHIYRHRWRDKSSRSFMVDLKEHAEFAYPGTRYSKEFAIFLKVANGQRTDNSTVRWSDLHD